MWQASRGIQRAGRVSSRYLKLTRSSNIILRIVVLLTVSLVPLTNHQSWEALPSRSNLKPWLCRVNTQSVDNPRNDTKKEAHAHALSNNLVKKGSHKSQLRYRVNTTPWDLPRRGSAVQKLCSVGLACACFGISPPLFLCRCTCPLLDTPQEHPHRLQAHVGIHCVSFCCAEVRQDTQYTRAGFLFRA